MKTYANIREEMLDDLKTKLGDLPEPYRQISETTIEILAHKLAKMWEELNYLEEKIEKNSVQEVRRS